MKRTKPNAPITPDEAAEVVRMLMKLPSDDRRYVEGLAAGLLHSADILPGAKKQEEDAS